MTSGKLNKNKTHSLKNKNEILPSQDITETLAEFYRLETLTTDNMKEHEKKYVIIRLVTVIEQFFREILRIHLTKNGVKEHSDITVKRSLLVDCFTSNAPIKSDNVSQKKIIDGLIDKFTIPCNDSYVLVTPKSLDCIFSKNPILHLKEKIISTACPFQSIYSIENRPEIRDLLTDFFEATQAKTHLKRNDYETFFDVRHMLVHTLADKKLDIVKYLAGFETMFEYVFGKIGFQHTSFDFYRGMAAYQDKEYPRAIQHFDNAGSENADYETEYYIGDSFREIDDYRSAEKHLDNAFTYMASFEKYLSSSALQKNLSVLILKTQLKHITYFYYLVGDSFAEMEKYDKGASCFIHSARINSAYNFMSFSVEDLLAYSPMIDLSTTNMCKILELQSEPLKQFIEYGQVFSELHRNKIKENHAAKYLEKAITCFRKAEKLDPKNITVRHELDLLTKFKKN